MTSVANPCSPHRAVESSPASVSVEPGPQARRLFAIVPVLVHSHLIATVLVTTRCNSKSHLPTAKVGVTNSLSSTNVVEDVTDWLFSLITYRGTELLMSAA